MLTATPPSLPACSRATRINSRCALCNAPIVGTSTRRFPERLCDEALTLATVVKIFIPEIANLIVDLFDPNRLAREVKFFVLKISPTRTARQVVQFRKGKCARGGNARVIARHRFTKNECGQKINADRGEKSASQIGHKNKFLREFVTTSQEAHGVFIAEMMKRERTKHDVVGIRRLPFQDVCIDI